MLKIYNTMTRRKEIFKTQDGRLVKMYSCGPTVYDVPHLGNYRSFVMTDNIRRYLEYLGYEVRHAMNITDIDDKTIRRSTEEGIPLKEYTKRYEEAFFMGLKTLNVLPAHHYPRATENFDYMLRIVEDLESKGLAYERGGSVYFDVSKFEGYGKLSGIDLEKMKITPGARVDKDEYDKDSPQDFALLKRSTEDEISRGIYFTSKWGKVRPGWHIECSALALKYLGPTIDIHTGGEDLIFPHHENEIAQSESFTGRCFVRYWVHMKHLMVNGEKMSKSLGNIITLEDLLDKYPPEVIRYMFISTHYRKTLNFTDQFAENAKSNYDRLRNAYENMLFGLATSRNGGSHGDASRNDPYSPDEDLLKQTETSIKQFREAMDDDFNNPLAVAALHNLAKAINKYLLRARNRAPLQKAREAFEEMAEVLGLRFSKPPPLTAEQAQLVREREQARAERNFEKADTIRESLKKQGIILEDTEWGTKWSYDSHRDSRE